MVSLICTCNKLYRLRGYAEVERIGVPLWNGEALPVVKMIKQERS